MKDFNQLKKNLKKDFSHFKNIKIALLGDTATQLLVQAIRGVGYEKGLDLRIWEADYDQIERQIFDLQSEMYEYSPSIIVLFYSSHKLLNKYNKGIVSEAENFADNHLSLIKGCYETLCKNTTARIIFYNYQEINDAIYGSYAAKIESSFLFQLRKINYKLMLFARDNNKFFLCDLSSIQNHHGRKAIFHNSLYVNTDLTLSLETLPEVASKTMDIISSFEGNVIKCVILDLDNTLWGGVIGDDGLQNIQIGNLGIGKAFTEFQYWLKKLKNRGIILAVCSKNTDSVAREAFEAHPDMVLKLEDIAIFIANWDSKVENIIGIQKVLNLGFDSMLFLDDNPFERNFVRENLPDIKVPELPEDPAEYLQYLYSLNLFDTGFNSSNELDRTKLYQVESQRISLKNQFETEGDFLKNLEMKSSVDQFNVFNTPRVAQLSQRSNQFNLRTQRYTEGDIEAIITSKKFFSFTFTLEDKFGDNGLVSIVVLSVENPETLFIQNWLMSCRVLKRGMENFVLNVICDFAKNSNFKTLKGEYIPSGKNMIVKDHYQKLGFTELDGQWIQYLDQFQLSAPHIKLKL